MESTALLEVCMDLFSPSSFATQTGGYSSLLTIPAQSSPETTLNLVNTTVTNDSNSQIPLLFASSILKSQSSAELLRQLLSMWSSVYATVAQVASVKHQKPNLKGNRLTSDMLNPETHIPKHKNIRRSSRGLRESPLST